MDDATAELRRKIDEMLLGAERQSTQQTSAKVGEDGGHGLLGAFHMEDFARKGPAVAERDEKADIQAEVRHIIKNCLMVEDEAREIKKGKPLSRHQKLYAEKQPVTKPQPTKSATMRKSYGGA